MISLRKSIDQIEEAEERFDTAMECYRSAIDSVAEHIVPVHKDLSLRHAQQLRALRRKIGLHPSLEDLQQCRHALDEQLRDFAEKATEILTGRETDVKAIIEVLAEAVRTLSTQHDAHKAWFEGFTTKLEQVTRLNSLGEIRRRLTDQVEELKGWVVSSENQKSASLDQLKKELGSFQERLERAERLAFTDPLTEVGNRAEGERKLAELIGCGQRFSVLLFDLNDFKIVNDRYGHLVGDAVLRAFSQRLAQHVRPEDAVCRWGGDEFLVILVGCSLENAMNRAKALSSLCVGDYALTVMGIERVVDVRVSVGPAEYVRGETAEELLMRADKFMYREKEMPIIGESTPCSVRLDATL